MYRLSRRQLLQTALLAGTGLALEGCSLSRHDDDVRSQTLRSPPQPALPHLLHLASLAANSHNTQPWRFGGNHSHLWLRADPARSCPAADPDQHHLYMSLGCAAENLLLAAPSLGWHVEPVFGVNGQTDFHMHPTMPQPAGRLAAAIPRRQSCRRLYEPGPLPPELVQELAHLVPPGQRIQLITARQQIDELAEHSGEAAAAQMTSAAFREELLHWLRFSESRYLRTRDGLFAACSGNPALPEWLGRRLFSLWGDADSERRRVREQVRHSSALLLLWSEGDDRHSWIQAGRLYQRLSLYLTTCGLAQAPINPLVELPAGRQALARRWQTRERPNLLVRIGHARPLPYSLRRPWQAIWLPGPHETA